MFWHYRVILRELVICTLPSYTIVTNAAVGNIIYIKKFHIDSLYSHWNLNIKKYLKH